MRILHALAFVLVAAASPPRSAAAERRFPRRPTSPRRRPTRSRPRPASPRKSSRPAPARTTRRKTTSSRSTTPGWTTDGKMFDSSVARGKPATFRVDRVIAGFSEGLQLMVPGEKRRLWIPEALAYKGTREPKGMLVFDVELIDIAAPRAPADVKAPPADAKKTASGLAYKVLKQGTGGAASEVEQPGHGALHRLDDRREDVRQLGRARRAGDLPARRRDRGMDRRRAADGRRREDALLDSRRTSPTRARARPTACWCSTWSCSRSSRAAGLVGLRGDWQAGRPALRELSELRRACPIRRRRPGARSTEPADRPAPAIAAAPHAAHPMMRRIARWKRSASARRVSSGTGPMRDQLACA